MKRYLIISLQGIGDLLLATPIAAHIKKTDAESRVCVLTFKGNAEILKGNTDVDMAYMINNARTRDLPYILGMIWSLKKERFDASICAYPSGIRSALIGYLSGSKARIGQGLKIFDNYKWLFTSNARVEDVKHAVEMNLDLLAAYGMDINGAEKRPRIDISEADIAAAGAFLDENGISGKDMVIAVHSGGGIYTALYRCWPEERFSAVSDTLAEKYGAKVVIIGGKQDYGNASRVAGFMKHTPAISAGRLNLKQTAALLKRSRLLICNNSGPMHIAAALNVPTVSIFGAADPRIHRPWGSGHAVLQSGLECSPCYYPFLRDTLEDTAKRNRWFGKRFYCVTKDYRCMLKISIDDVIKASEGIIEKRG